MTCRLKQQGDNVFARVYVCVHMSVVLVKYLMNPRMNFNEAIRKELL